MNFRIAHSGLFLVCVPVAFGILFVLIFRSLLHQAETETWHETQSKAIVSHVNTIFRNIYEGSQALVTYSMSRSPSARQEYLHNCEDTIAGLVEMQELAIDEPKQAKNVIGLGRVVNQELSTLERVKAMMEEQDQAARSASALANTIPVRRQISSLLSQLTVQSRHIIDEEQREQDRGVLSGSTTRQFLIDILYCSLVVNVIGALCLAHFFSRRITRRLELLVDNVQRLARREPLSKPLDGGDEIAYLDVAFHRMANKLNELSRKERAIVDKAVDVICTIDDKNLEFSAVNPAALDVWGYAPHELIGRRMTDLLPAGEVAKTTRAFIEMADGKSSVKAFDTRILRKDGAIVDMVWSATWSAEQKSLFCVAHDVTERKELERLKQEFVAMVSHDLRTPLTSIQFAISYVLLMAADKIPPDALEELEAADRIGENLINFVNSMLDMEKLEAGRLELNLERMKISNLITRAVESVQGFAHRNEITVEKPLTDAVLVADEDRLLQVLVNLLSNAIKFSPRGSSVVIQVQEVENTVQISVRDEGRGIPEDFCDAIFDRFQQVRMTSFRQKGTGLGLAIAKAMVEAHGGTIGLESEEGKGSTFWFRIPTALEASSKEQAQNAELI